MDKVDVVKTKTGILSRLGLSRKKQHVALQVSEAGLFYDSTLGKVGLIPKDAIEFIKLGSLRSSPVLLVAVKKEFNLLDRLSSFKQRVSKVYKEESGAEILIFPQDVDMNLDELESVLKQKLNLKMGSC